MARREHPDALLLELINLAWRHGYRYAKDLPGGVGDCPAILAEWRRAHPVELNELDFEILGSDPLNRLLMMSGVIRDRNTREFAVAVVTYLENIGKGKT